MTFTKDFGDAIENCTKKQEGYQPVEARSRIQLDATRRNVHSMCYPRVVLLNTKL